MRISNKKLVFSALCLALALVLPFLTGQIPQIGQMLSPMHIPVLLCGFVCGWPYGLIVGAIAPIMRHVMFGMPPILTALAMTFELAAYGAISGYLYAKLPKKTINIYISLIAAMILGRIIWGIASVIILGLSGSGFTWAAFIGGAVLNAVPGIICHILLIPIIVMALKKSKLI